MLASRVQLALRVPLQALRAPQQVLRAPLSPFRGLATSGALGARGRARYVKGGSNRQDLGPEARELIAKARDMDDLSWQLGPGVEEPITLDLRTEERTRALQYEVPYKGYGTKVNNGDDLISYYPHTGEVMPEDRPSPVLMVTKVKSKRGEPYWVKAYMDQIGLGGFGGGQVSLKKVGSRVFLPNLPSVSAVLYRIKHMVEVTPLTFPCGFPEDFHPDTHGFTITNQGEFIVQGAPQESLDSVARRAHWMKLSTEDIKKEARKHWEQPWASPLGNSNYHRESGWQDDSKRDSQFTQNQKKKWS